MSFDHSLPMRLRTAYLTMHRHAQARFEPLGITADQYVLMRLAQEQPGLTQQDLVERSASDPSTIAAMAKLLEARGLVTRQASATDRRARCIRLTPAGLRLLDQVRPLDDALHQLLGKLFTPEDVADLETALQQIAAAPELKSPRARRAAPQSPATR